MKPIGEEARKLEAEILAGRTRTWSDTDGHGTAGADQGEGGAAALAGHGAPDCPSCGGVGLLRVDVPVGHQWFGKALPCQCIAERMAARRAAVLRRSSDMAGLERMTFDSFRTDAPGNSPSGRRSLEEAKAAACDFAGAPDGWLVLRGSLGCGKTHLAAAVVNACTAREVTAIFLCVPDLLDYLRSSYAAEAHEGFDDRFDALRDAPLLVLDDLGAQSPTPWAGEKLFQLLNYRYNARLPTVITTNQDFDDMDERLRSRLGHFGFVRIVEIEAIDYRGGIVHRADDISSLHLYADMTFASWDARSGELDVGLAENLARAQLTAREFAESPVGWLVITGDHGCGKTHLAAAIANRVLSSGQARAVVFVTVADFLDHLRATFGPATRVRFDQRFEAARECDLLILDDLGLESATPWAREKLFQLLGHRHAARAATVITTAAGLADLHPWLRARLVDRRRCVVFEILAPAYGLRPAPAASSRRVARARR